MIETVVFLVCCLHYHRVFERGSYHYYKFVIPKINLYKLKRTCEPIHNSKTTILTLVMAIKN